MHELNVMSILLLYNQNSVKYKNLAFSESRLNKSHANLYGQS